MYSNDPETPRFALTLTGEILVDVLLQPRMLAFGQLGKGEESTKEFTLKVNEPEKVKVTGVTIDDDRFKLKQKAKAEPGETETWEVTFKGGDKLGRINTGVKVALEGTEVDQVQLPVRGSVVGDLRYSKNLYFVKRDGAFQPRDLIFTSRSGKKVEIKGAEDKGGKLKLDVTAAKGDKATISVSVLEAEATYDPPQRNKIVVQTNDPDEPSVEIGYTISDRQGPRGARLGKGIKGGDAPLRLMPPGAPPRKMKDGPKPVANPPTEVQ